MVRLLLLIVVMALLPWELEGAVRLVRRVQRRWRARHPRPEQPAAPPIERLSADLARLLAQLDAIERSNPPAKVARLRATSMAYDDVLLAACRALEVQVPAESSPLHPLDRLQAEAELARHGLRW